MWRAPLCLALIYCGSALFSKACAADIGAEQSALLYDLLSPLNAGRAPDNVDPEIYARALDILRAEKLLTSGGRPNYQEKGLLERYGRALFLGNRSTQFATEIAQIHDLVATGDRDALREALTVLWEKAGRKTPTDAMLQPVLNSLYKTKSAQPKETINFRAEGGDYTVTIKHAVAGGRLKVTVDEQDDRGSSLSRTVFQGATQTLPTKGQSELQRTIKLEKTCTNTPETDAQKFASLPKDWRSRDNDMWELKGTKDALVFVRTDVSGQATEYKGQMKNGAIYAEHLITRANVMGSSIPLEIRRQIAALGNKTFRIYLEVCNDDDRELDGTWSSQHVLYNPLVMQITEFYDPYDLALQLTNGERAEDQVAEGAVAGEWP